MINFMILKRYEELLKQMRAEIGRARKASEKIERVYKSTNGMNYLLLAFALDQENTMLIK